MPVSTTDPREHAHHHFGFSKGQFCLQNKTRMPTSCRRLEAAILLVSELEDEEQRVSEHHEHMFA